MAERIVELVRPIAKMPLLPGENSKKRVAAYARVSTDSDEQMGSVKAQKDYFEKLIHSNSEWIFAGIYADEGISGTSLNRREAFNQMIMDALDGKIDLIITKSLSRFARNTVDALNVIRKLKVNNIGVYFEKEDINTLDSKGEFLITLMSSLAEEESRSISENIKWGQRKRFADGKYSLPYKQFLGYKKGADGYPEIVEDEAVVIKAIYRLFLDGYSPCAIATRLTENNIPTPSGNDVWHNSTINSILHNEKYYGAALLQKRYCVDYRTKKTKRNDGELPMYYIPDSHTGIITKEVFDEVQKRLNDKQHNFNSLLPFAGKLYCSDCDALFTPIPFHSNTYNDVVWKCANRHHHNFKCATPHLYEELLKPIFHEIILAVLKENPGIVKTCASALNTVRTGSNKMTQNTILSAVTGYDISYENEVRIWRTIIQKVFVHPEHMLEFHIIDGSVIKHQMTKITPRTNRMSKNTKERILQEYANRKKPSAIAREFNISINTVKSVIRRSNPPNSSSPKIACQNCGKEFFPNSKKQKYCSHKCSIEKRFSKKSDRSEE